MDTNISDSGLNFGTLEPGQSVSGYIAFEVPSTEDSFYLWWDPAPLAPRVLVDINNLNAGRHSGRKLRLVCERAIVAARLLNYDGVPPWQALPDDDALQLSEPILDVEWRTCLPRCMTRWLREAARFVIRKEGLTAHAPYNALVAYRRPGRRGFWVNLLVEFAAPSLPDAINERPETQWPDSSESLVVSPPDTSAAGAGNLLLILVGCALVAAHVSISPLGQRRATASDGVPSPRGEYQPIPANACSYACSNRPRL